MITVIGISGKKLTGKDTLCEALLNQANVQGTRIGFADALKEEVAKACEVTMPFINANKQQFRPILQWWGTDFRRHYKGDLYWVEQAFLKINAAIKQGKQLIIIPDVRFISEAEPLRSLGAHLIRMARPIEFDDNHPSETELDSYKHFHQIVLNNGTIGDLNKQAHALLTKLNIPIK